MTDKNIKEYVDSCKQLTKGSPSWYISEIKKNIIRDFGEEIGQHIVIEWW